MLYDVCKVHTWIISKVYKFKGLQFATDVTLAAIMFDYSAPIDVQIEFIP